MYFSRWAKSKMFDVFQQLGESDLDLGGLWCEKVLCQSLLSALSSQPTHVKYFPKKTSGENFHRRSLKPKDIPVTKWNFMHQLSKCIDCDNAKDIDIYEITNSPDEK